MYSILKVKVLAVVVDSNSNSDSDSDSDCDSESESTSDSIHSSVAAATSTDRNAPRKRAFIFKSKQQLINSTRHYAHHSHRSASGDRPQARTAGLRQRQPQSKNASAAAAGAELIRSESPPRRDVSTNCRCRVMSVGHLHLGWREAHTALQNLVNSVNPGKLSLFYELINLIAFKDELAMGNFDISLGLVSMYSDAYTF